MKPISSFRKPSGFLFLFGIVSVILLSGIFLSNCRREINNTIGPAKENLPQSVIDFIKKHSGEVIFSSNESVA